MHIYCLGINHHSAGVCLREKLAFSEASVKAALARLGCGLDAQTQLFSEMVILSTCNRVEIYAVSAYPVLPELESFLAEVRDIQPAELAPHLYRLVDVDAISHLLHVAAGLDSMVLGEPQILGQVMQAFELARGQSSVGPILSRLFQTALHAGKRARTETHIGHNPASIASVAVKLAEQMLPALDAAQIVVLGAGEMAELAVEALRKRGVQRILVVNRTLARARSLAERWGGEASTFEQLTEALHAADILVTSTGAPHTLIHTDLVLDAMQTRPDRPLVIIDIALPRDVDAEVGALPGVSLYDLDALQQKLEYSLVKRQLEIPHVEAILQSEMQEFLNYLQALDVFPVIAAMRQQAETIRMAELEKTLRRLPHLTSEDRERLDALTQALVKKILHTPINELRLRAGSPQSAEVAAAARTLFGLQSGAD